MNYFDDANSVEIDGKHNVLKTVLTNIKTDAVSRAGCFIVRNTPGQSGCRFSDDVQLVPDIYAYY